jgi:RND family efflux transporter MFP subunit
MDSGRKKFVIGIGVLLVLALIVGIVHLRRAVLIVPVITIGYAPFAIELPESGVVQYPQVQTMSSEIAGNIGRVFVRTGERVTAEQPLVTIENPEITAAAQTSEAAYRSASARAESAEVTGSSNVVQAEAAVETARARLAQAQQDMANGLQSGLGYGETTATAQRAQADANLATAATALREARRVYLAYRYLYASEAVSRDQLDQAEAKYEEAQVSYGQAHLQRSSLGTQLIRSRVVLADNLRAAQEGFAQAVAQLSAARVESGSGDVAAARAEAARAGSEYALSREQADATQIRAPYDATVLSVATEKNDPLRPLQPGDAVVVGQSLVTLAAQRAFVVRTKVDEQDVIDVGLGQRAQITGEDFPNRTLTGQVVEISPIATARSVPITIRIDRAPAYLRDGMSVDVNILTTDLPRAIVVPNDAIVRDSGTTYVYLVRQETAFKQAVRVGPSNETGSAIESGLRQGDVIVAGSVVGLADGASVSISSLAASPRP